MLDFTKQKKKFHPVKMPDGTVLNLLMPKKKLFEQMAGFENDDGETVHDVAELYSITAEILSTNLQKKQYTADEIGEWFDLEDVRALYSEYVEFVSEIANNPN